MAQRFSTRLKTTKRQWLAELREQDASVGAWNADATTSDRPMGDFAEVRNMRKMRPGSLEVRSGFRQWTTLAVDVNNQQTKTPLWKAEYRCDSTFVDATFYSESGKLYALFLHPAGPNAGSMETVFVADCGSNPVVCATQFQTYLVVSLVASDLADPADIGTYALYPSNPDCFTPKNGKVWNLISLGKQVSPTPGDHAFTEKIFGKLYVNAPSGVSFDASFKEHQPTGFQKNPDTGEIVTVPLDIKAPYFLSPGSQVPNHVSPAIKFWTPAKNDAPHATDPLNTPSSRRVMSRGWWYRVVLKRKLFDVRNQPHIFSEAPSVDFYIEERIYIPPFAGAVVNTQMRSPLLIGAMLNHNLVEPEFRDPAGVPPKKQSTAWPTHDDFSSLREKWKANVGEIAANSDPLFFAAASLSLAGFKDGEDAQSNVPPYSLEVGAHDVNGAPNAIFAWADFALNPTLETSLYQIDFYRTAYSYPDEAQNKTRSPKWGTAYNYGYVGTLHSGDTQFTDDVSDAGILFESTPLAAEGYLEGEFAGEVIRPYQDHVVLGNTRTKYHVRTPWPRIQAFAFPFDGTPSAYDKADVNPNAGMGDGLARFVWFYAYIDGDGNTSDAVRIFVQSPIKQDGSDFSRVRISFMFPRGYSDRITGAVLYRSTWTGDPLTGSRSYAIEATVPLSVGEFVSNGPSALTAIVPAPLLTTNDTVLQTGNTLSSHDPGYLVFSSKNNPWSWPIDNMENHHDQNPMTGMEEVIGPLVTSSDRGVVMTRLNNYLEPVNTAASGAGCISRFAQVKVNIEWFFVSSSGLMYVDGTGVHPFPANIQTEIVKRLREPIPGEPSLAGVRERVSMSYLANRRELWITFPSTIEMGGVLAARTFIVKFLEGKIYAYEFEIASGLVPQSDPPIAYREPVGRVIHLPHADGSMFSSFALPADGDNPNPLLLIQDNDVPEIPWPGKWALQYQHAMGSPNIAKMLFAIKALVAARCRMWLTTGMLRQDGNTDFEKGTISPLSATRELVLQNNTGAATEYAWQVSGSLAETSGTPPAWRIIGQPDEWGNNEFAIESFDVWFGYLHAHR